jgi:hypothetical protein
MEAPGTFYWQFRYCILYQSPTCTLSILPSYIFNEFSALVNIEIGY